MQFCDSVVNRSLMNDMADKTRIALGVRVRMRRKFLGLSAEEVAERMRQQSGTKTAQAAISSLESGRTKTFRDIAALAKALEMTMEELVNELPANLDVKNISPQPPVGSIEPLTVPILGKANGSSGGVIVMTTGRIGTAPRHPKQDGIRDAFALYVAGDSMAPRYRQGELVYCISNIPPTAGQDCVVELENGEAYVKEFMSWSNGKIVCRQHNPAEQWKRPAVEVKAVHVIVGRG